MKSPEQKLEDWLAAYGWELEWKEKEELEWWADEIWKLRSVWSPMEAEAYIIFLVDPQWEGNRKKGQGVWGMGGCLNYPRERREAESLATMSYQSQPKSEYERFLESFEIARNAYSETKRLD